MLTAFLLVAGLARQRAVLPSTPAITDWKIELTPGELQAVDAAVKGAHPASWSECDSLAGGSNYWDRIRTALTLTERSERDVYVTSFLLPPLPNDLQNIVDALRGPAGLDSCYRPL